GAVADGLVFVPTQEDRSLDAVDAASGHLRWRFEDHAGNGNLAAVVGRTVYLPGDDRIVYAIEVDSGKAAWQIAVQGVPGAMAITDGRMILGTDLGRLLSISGTTPPP